MPPKRAPKPKRSASRKQVDSEPNIGSNSGKTAPLTTTKPLPKVPRKALRKAPPKSILKKTSKGKEKELEKPKNLIKIASDSESLPLKLLSLKKPDFIGCLIQLFVDNEEANIYQLYYDLNALDKPDIKAVKQKVRYIVQLYFKDKRIKE